MVSVGALSVRGDHVAPLSNDCHTPPPAAPTNRCAELEGSTAMALTRPTTSTLAEPYVCPFGMKVGPSHLQADAPRLGALAKVVAIAAYSSAMAVAATATSAEVKARPCAARVRAARPGLPIAPSAESPAAPAPERACSNCSSRAKALPPSGRGLSGRGTAAVSCISPPRMSVFDAVSNPGPVRAPARSSSRDRGRPHCPERCTALPRWSPPRLRGGPSPREEGRGHARTRGVARPRDLSAARAPRHPVGRAFTHPQGGRLQTTRIEAAPAERTRAGECAGPSARGSRPEPGQTT